MQKVLRTPKVTFPQHVRKAKPDKLRRWLKDGKNQCSSSSDMEKLLSKSSDCVRYVRRVRCSDNKSSGFGEGHHQQCEQECQVECAKRPTQGVSGGLEAPANHYDDRADTYSAHAKLAQAVPLRSIASLAPRVR
jgi:hypothetical protein